MRARSQIEELQFRRASYRQVLTSEGLTAFANASYGWGRPGTPQLRDARLQDAQHLVEAGPAYPVIRSRETNLTSPGSAS